MDPQTAHVTGHLNQVGSKVSIDQKTTDPQFPGLQLLLGGELWTNWGVEVRRASPACMSPTQGTWTARLPGSLGGPLLPLGTRPQLCGQSSGAPTYRRHRPLWAPGRGSAGGQPQWMLQVGGLREDIRTERGVLS